jgi:hypothetical protein
MLYTTDVLLDEYPGPVDTTFSKRDEKEITKTLCCYLECPADRSKVRVPPPIFLRADRICSPSRSLSRPQAKCRQTATSDAGRTVYLQDH